jgi:hypothetical protein
MGTTGMPLLYYYLQPFSPRCLMCNSLPSPLPLQVDVMCVGITGMPLLQLAVRSQRLDLVRTLLDWGEAHGEWSELLLNAVPASCQASCVLDKMP